MLDHNLVSIARSLSYYYNKAEPANRIKMSKFEIYRLGHIYSMDQTPLPFEFLRGRTYEFKGKKTVWVRPLRSSWIKRPVLE